MLATSTEDGRVLFYSATPLVDLETRRPAEESGIPVCEALCQLGGAAEGLTGRIKDFEVLRPPQSENQTIVTGSSDGAIRIWQIDKADLISKSAAQEDDPKTGNAHAVNGEAVISEQVPGKSPKIKQVGQLLGTYEAGNRITCLKAFVMVNSEQATSSGVAKNTEHESD